MSATEGEWGAVGWKMLTITDKGGTGVEQKLTIADKGGVGWSGEC